MNSRTHFVKFLHAEDKLSTKTFSEGCSCIMSYTLPKNVNFNVILYVYFYPDFKQETAAIVISNELKKMKKSQAVHHKPQSRLLEELPLG